ncbi:AraC family transcriptional regulator [Gemmiger sp.]|uniref:AraC family transcriptional regulator n=1 Tax=Gemmiger sp. TaxID=2049027 RepID=UPI003A9257CF
MLTVLLATTDRSIAAVAAAVGILDVNYFTKIFKKQLVTTPTQYRREKKAMLGH